MQCPHLIKVPTARDERPVVGRLHDVSLGTHLLWFSRASPGVDLLMLVLGTKHQASYLRQVLYHWAIFPASLLNFFFFLRQGLPKLPRLLLNLLSFISLQSSWDHRPGSANEPHFFTTSQALWSHELTVSAAVWVSAWKCSQIKDSGFSL